MSLHHKKTKPSTSNRASALLIAGAICVASGYQLMSMRSIAQQLEPIQANALESRSFQDSLSNDLSGVRVELELLRKDLERASDQADYATQLAERLNSAEVQLGDIGQTMEAQAQSLSLLELDREEFAVKAELQERDERFQEHWSELTELASDAHRLADESRQKLDRLGAEFDRDLGQMWRELMGPVVQLSGDSSVGSGVLLRSRFQENDGTYATYLLTAWHVVRDIQGDLSNQDMPVPVTIYGEDGTLRSETASLLCFEASLDAALLEVVTPDRLSYGSALASREQLAKIRIFDEIYAVGCPLGNDPIPTRGEVATRRHEVDGETYWMINAPTYIGNSGGGIFETESHVLLGIFSKIYTHGSFRPTIVPHMGLVTPLSSVYDWLETEGYPYEEFYGDSLEATELETELATASAE